VDSAIGTRQWLEVANHIAEIEETREKRWNEKGKERRKIQTGARSRNGRPPDLVVYTPK
jgi:hypothetical protein